MGTNATGERMGTTDQQKDNSFLRVKMCITKTRDHYNQQGLALR
jgi:hypothetical protein